MWEYRQEIDLETSVKISPYCHSWPSVCWFTLKGLDLWKLLVWDRSPTYLVIFTFLLIGICWLIFKKIQRKWNDVPMSEIRSLRERVQFVTQDMAMLQDALNATIINKPQEFTDISTSSNGIDVLYETEPNANNEKFNESIEPFPLEFPNIRESYDPVQEVNAQQPVIPHPKPEDDSVAKIQLRVSKKFQGKQNSAVSKSFIKPEPKKVIYESKLDVGKRTLRKRQYPSLSKIGWKV
ncbi:uncharacterized protein LOC6534087 [Drosophila yakuba]|uniref:Uncharacterized protein n=1 Tax=Drosophila yakuba TaxID=7245 RepID=B4PI10_DROYA|nr:uncharacterized protein LOC6534087 [Drosophila yakuba]EDW94485.1 uncharacterized protein Dyak_GE22007 [Drosophila yakuba]